MIRFALSEVEGLRAKGKGELCLITRRVSLVNLDSRTRVVSALWTGVI
jgi:hypothetical protein